ncbi:uncharacterized protein M8220_014421 [Acridotheres tristis]
MAARVPLPDLLNLAAKGGWHSKEPARSSGMPAHDADTDPTGAIFGGVSNRADISFSPVLRDSGAFEYTWKELSVWLEHLDNTKEDQKEAEIQFLERILLKLVTNPCPYTDKAADLVQAASVLQVALFKQDSDNINIPVSHIDGMWVSRGCLTLLSAMVAQGPDSAKDVYSHFDFNNKYLPGLLKKGFKKIQELMLASFTKKAGPKICFFNKLCMQYKA